MPDRSFDLLTDAVEAINAARDPDRALDAAIDVLRPQYSLWTASLIEYPQPGQARFVAFRSPFPGVLEAGVEVNTNITADVRDITEALGRGRPMFIVVPEVDLGLLGDLTEQQGVRASMLIPLMQKKELVGLMTLGSSDAGAFTKEDIPFFTGVGKGVEDHLVALIRRSA